MHGATRAYMLMLSCQIRTYMIARIRPGDNPPALFFCLRRKSALRRKYRCAPFGPRPIPLSRRVAFAPLCSLAASRGRGLSRMHKGPRRAAAWPLTRFGYRAQASRSLAAPRFAGPKPPPPACARPLLRYGAPTPRASGSRLRLRARAGAASRGLRPPCAPLCRSLGRAVPLRRGPLCGLPLLRHNGPGAVRRLRRLSGAALRPRAVVPRPAGRGAHLPLACQVRGRSAGPTAHLTRAAPVQFCNQAAKGGCAAVRPFLFLTAVVTGDHPPAPPVGGGRRVTTCGLLYPCFACGPLTGQPLHKALSPLHQCGLKAPVPV